MSSAGLEGDLGGLEQRYRQMKPLWVVLCLIKRMSGTRRKLAKITFRDLSMKRLKNTRRIGAVSRGRGTARCARGKADDKDDRARRRGAAAGMPPWNCNS